jgi:hypothetical protein
VSGKVLLLVVGLVVGALVGFLTRPQAAEIRLGPVSVEVQGDRPAAAGDPVTGGQWQYIGIVTLIGGLIGGAVGFVVDRRQ